MNGIVIDTRVFSLKRKDPKTKKKDKKAPPHKPLFRPY